MPDRKRLPMLNAIFDDDGLVCVDEDDLSHKMLVGRRLVHYVPEPATCATCSSCRKLPMSGKLCCDEGMIIIPQDGTGFCHNHPDNQRKNA